MLEDHYAIRAHARHRTGLSIARRKASTALSPASLMSRDDRGGTAGPDWQGVWQGLVPKARDVFSGETDWQLAGGRQCELLRQCLENAMQISAQNGALEIELCALGRLVVLEMSYHVRWGNIA